MFLAARGAMHIGLGQMRSEFVGVGRDPGLPGRRRSVISATDRRNPDPGGTLRRSSFETFALAL